MTSYVSPEYLLPDELLNQGRSQSAPTTTESTTQDVFGLYGPAGFAPFYVPSRFSVVKERNLDRTESFCGGENVSDLGSKNREIHIAGWMLQSEVSSFGGVLDSAEPHDMITPGWSGEVRIVDGEYEGPISLDPHSREKLYQYSMNVVSTGEDEPGASVEDGILSGPVPEGLRRLGFG